MILLCNVNKVYGYFQHVYYTWTLCHFNNLYSRKFNNEIIVIYTWVIMINVMSRKDASIPAHQQNTDNYKKQRNSWNVKYMPRHWSCHYNDVIMGAIVSQMTSLTIVCSTVYSGAGKKTSKLRVTGLCAGNSPRTGEFPTQMASNAENFSIWWRHHVPSCKWESNQRGGRCQLRGMPWVHEYIRGQGLICTTLMN